MVIAPTALAMGEDVIELIILIFLENGVGLELHNGLYIFLAHGAALFVIPSNEVLKPILM